VTAEKTFAAIRQFVEGGGVAIAIGSSATTLASALALPVSDHLVADGAPLPNTKFYVPGSVVRATVDTAHPLAAGVGPAVDVFFDESPVFALAADAASHGATRVAWYQGKTPLRSGGAWGQEALDGGAAIVAASVGRGKVFLFGPEILQRGQPHGTFKFLFNAIYWGRALRTVAGDDGRGRGRAVRVGGPTHRARAGKDRNAPSTAPTSSTVLRSVSSPP
jgi:hypothetical protein